MRALLIDDHLLFSQSLRFLLEDLDPSLACESAVSIAEAVAKIGPFDIILLDYALPDSHGLEGLRRVLQAHDEASVVMLSGDERPELVHALIEAGAAGFVPKSSDMDTLLQALRTMLAGGVYLPAFALARRKGSSPAKPTAPTNTSSASSSAADTFADSGFGADEAINLPPRQLECLLRLVQGKPNKTIARELGLGESTVKSHLSAAFRALGVNNRTEAVFKAARLGLLPPAANGGDSATGQPPGANQAPTTASASSAEKTAA
jgi:DNA-binding NarL/FixJ family response regulator